MPRLTRIECEEEGVVGSAVDHVLQSGDDDPAVLFLSVAETTSATHAIATSNASTIRRRFDPVIALFSFTARRGRASSQRRCRDGRSDWVHLLASTLPSVRLAGGRRPQGLATGRLERARVARWMGRESSGCVARASQRDDRRSPDAFRRWATAGRGTPASVDPPDSADPASERLDVPSVRSPEMRPDRDQRTAEPVSQCIDCGQVGSRRPPGAADLIAERRQLPRSLFGEEPYCVVAQHPPASFGLLAGRCAAPLCAGRQLSIMPL